MKDEDKEEWAIIKDGKLQAWPDSGNMTFKRSVAEAIKGVMGGQLCRITLEVEK